MRQRDKGKIKIVFYLRVFKPCRLRDGRPELVQVLYEGILEVFEGCSTDMITDDEE